MTKVNINKTQNFCIVSAFDEDTTEFISEIQKLKVKISKCLACKHSLGKENLSTEIDVKRIDFIIFAALRENKQTHYNYGKQRRVKINR